MSRLEHKMPLPWLPFMRTTDVGLTWEPVIHWWGVTAQTVTSVLVIGLFLDSGGLISFIRRKRHQSDQDPGVSWSPVECIDLPATPCTWEWPYC